MAALEAWYMDESAEDPRLPHKCHPDQPVALQQLQEVGVWSWKVRENHHSFKLMRNKTNIRDGVHDALCCIYYCLARGKCVIPGLLQGKVIKLLKVTR